MKAFAFLAVLLIGCASTQATPKASAPAALQECVEITPELLEERAKHESEMTKLSEHMHAEANEFMAYLVTTTGVFTDIKLHSMAFANNYEGAIVHFSAHQKGKQISDGYFALAKNTDGTWNLLGLYTKQTATTDTAPLEDNIKQLRNKTNEYKL